MNPRNKTVIITGASQGIGAATARAFATAGARVVLVARNAERLQALASELPQARAIPTDLREPTAIEQLVEQVHRDYRSIDIVVHNAGIGLAAPIATLSDADLHAALTLNLFAPLRLARATIPLMQQQRRGQQIFVSSVVGLRALPYLGGYAACKAALDRLTEALRVELRGSRIAVTLVRPGTTRTDFSAGRLGTGREIRRVNARVATPEQVAQTILRAARREPREAFVSSADRVTLAISQFAPWLADWMLARSFAWQPHDAG
jgi:short-subunit dehydrogenase